MKVPKKTARFTARKHPAGWCFTIILRGKRDFTWIMNSRVNSIENYRNQVTEASEPLFYHLGSELAGFSRKFKSPIICGSSLRIWEQQMWGPLSGDKLRGGGLVFRALDPLNMMCHSFASRDTQPGPLDDCAQMGMSLRGSEGSQNVGLPGWESVWSAKHCFASTAWSLISWVEETLRRRREVLWAKGKTSFRKG